MAKRYLVFAGSCYYPGGGWEDFEGSFDLISEAREHLSSQKNDWSDIIDSDSEETIGPDAVDPPDEPVDDQFNGPDELTEAQKLDIAEWRAKVATVRPPPAPGLSAVSVARAFEVMLPAHNGSLALRHNPHRAFGDTPAVYIARRGSRTQFVSPVEAQKAAATNELWLLSFMPATGEALKTHVAAATLPALAQWLQDNGLAFGS